MLRKSSRLKNNSAFQQVFRQGKPFFFHGMGCRILKGQERTRIGLSITKKMYPRAVDRNKAKRLIAETIRLRLSDMPTGAFAVFFFQRKPDRLEKDDIEERVSGILRNMR